MAYNIKVKNKNFAKHGNKVFDKQYFSHFFEKYSLEEINYYCRFFYGWIRFLNKYEPLNSGNRKRVLEIGCGIGAFSKILNERNFDVKATDISSYIIEKAKKNLPEIDFQILNIEENISEKNKYDYIFAFEVFEHLSKPTLAINNCYTLLKKNGTLIFSTPYPTKETLSDPFHINVNFPKFWLSKGKDIGFKEVKVKYASFIPFLYRFHSFFSRAMEVRIDSHYINSTCFYLFKK